MTRQNWDDWDDSETGGTPCACSKQCAERDYQGNAARGPRAFCATDERHIGTVIRQLPETYARIALLLAKTGQQEERVSGSREAPVPVNLEAETFMRHVVMVTLSWEEQVRAAARLSDPPDRVRDGAALARACELLGGRGDDRTGYLATLLGLEPEDKRRPVPGSKKVADLEPGSHLVVDAAGDAWENAERGGADAGLEFLALHARARAMLGLSPRRRRLPEVPCDGCGARTLVQREALAGDWEPVARCTNCPETYIGAQFELLMGRVYAAQVAALGNAR